MKYLFIDTSTSNLNVSILEDSNVIYSYNNFILSDMASKIMVIIDEALTKSNLLLNDIDKIFVVNGPGSFTGIRVGVTVAKTIAWALQKPIIPISSLEVIATTSINTKYSIPMIDARRGNVFVGVYDNELNCIEEDKLISLESILFNKNKDYTIISYDNIADSIKPHINVSKVILKHKNDKPLVAHSLNPHYLKLTEAEENKLKNDSKN